MQPYNRWFNSLANTPYPAANPAFYLASSQTTYAASYPASPQVPFPAIDLAANAQYLASSLASYSAADLGPQPPVTQPLYTTTWSPPNWSAFRPIRNNRRMGNQFINPYVSTRSEYPRRVVVRVPAIYACQLHNTGNNSRCPVACYRKSEVVSYLYVTGINDEPVHELYRWLVSLFERYPGFRDIHIMPGHEGAVVRFSNDVQTSAVKLALDGYWATPQIQLRVRFIDPLIYRYLHYPGISAEIFIQHS